MPPVLAFSLALLACGRPNAPADGAPADGTPSAGPSGGPAADAGPPEDEGGGQGRLAEEASAIDPDAFLQPGRWADQGESAATDDGCKVEDVDLVGDLMDAGRFTLTSTGDSTFSLLFEQEPPSDEDDDFGAISPAAWTCARSQADPTTFSCDPATWTADYTASTPPTRVTFTATVTGSITRSTAMFLDPVVQVTCEGPACGDPALGLSPPCSLSVRRVAVFVGP